MASMKTLLTGTLLLCFALSGCVVYRGHDRPMAYKSSVRCHPSQYWDGAMCRHKGQGHGARKHDGR
jgi:hypothetical protein